MQRLRMIAAASMAAFLMIPPAAAVTVNLVLVDSFARSSPFGLAFDGSNLWYTSGGLGPTEMTTAGIDTGNSTPGPSFQALGWDPGKSQLVAGVPGQNDRVQYFDRFTGANNSVLDFGTCNVDFANLRCIGLLDGLDIGPGGEIWYSNDVDFVNRFDSAGNVITPDPFLGGAGGYSGVERIDLPGADPFVIVVNDASNPRQLCIHEIDATEIGCTTFGNARYEDLAFDGRFLYVADLNGNKIDKIDLLVDGGSIFDPDGPGGPSVPEPATLTVLGAALLGLGAVRRQRRTV